MSAQDKHAPGRVRGRFFTPGTFILLSLMALGYAFGLSRFITGLDAVTNLNDAFPWGLWIAIDVACGVALAAGGFTTAALVEIFGRKKFAPLLRPAILTAWLGYAMVGFALLFDLGRYWNIWRPLFNWQGNSVLFEVGMCVMAYLFVLTIEMSASFLEGARERVEEGGLGASFLAKLEGPLAVARRVLRVVLPLFIIAGVVLSCMHQSSLGTLLVIAPTKMSPLWYTPIMPLLFLFSAFMVGFPMVVLESIGASRALGREPEMDLLAPLAKSIPFFIALYLVFKLGDLFVRRPALSFPEDGGRLTALIVELMLGLVAPLILFSLPAVRRSAGWLIFSSLLVIGGVVLNRVNVFLVAYEPPFPGAGYSPSFGEIALTLGMISTIMVLYRLFVFLFPILAGGDEPGSEEQRATRPRTELSPVFAWTARGVAVALIVAFVGIYAFVHREAVSGEIRAMSWVSDVHPIAQDDFARVDAGHRDRPEGYQRVYSLEAAVLNAREDTFEPVRFTHVMHDEWTGGDCSVCHHRFSWDDEDRIGETVEDFHEMFDIRIGGPCETCHDMETITIQRCSSCHGVPTDEDHPSRVGLKGAYHRQCMGCHEGEAQGTQAPLDCMGCHHPWTPDHADLIPLESYDEAYEIIETCVTCHADTGREILQTAHWNWSGHSPEVCGYEHSSDLGLRTLMSNHVLGVDANIDLCAGCHIGLGCLTGHIPFKGPNTVDCFVCHDTTGLYAKAVGGGGTPVDSVDLLEVARKVGRPSRERCGSCHFYSDGGPNLKHGDLEPALANPSDALDVHMGRYDLRCQDCHTTEQHRIAGMSLSAPAIEGRVRCIRCHSETPHGIAGPLSRHLDAHVASLACETCHIPSVAHESPTRTFIDYEKAAAYEGATELNSHGRPVYPPDSGVEIWESDLVPTYAWYDGTRDAVLVGESVDPSGTVALNRPHGSFNDPNAKIHPFKVHRARQAIDAELDVLLLAQLWKGLWSGMPLEEAVTVGMDRAGLEFSGELAFVETELYTGIHHEVVASIAALSCQDCHQREAVRCARCHTGGLDTRGLGAARDPERAPRLDFEELGYEGDPARLGGRSSKAIGPGRPVR